jgi:hypothetical protein
MLIFRGIVDISTTRSDKRQNLALSLAVSSISHLLSDRGVSLPSHSSWPLYRLERTERQTQAGGGPGRWIELRRASRGEGLKNSSTYSETDPKQALRRQELKIKFR